MSYQILIFHAINSILYIILQILFLHNVMLFNVGFCYIYIAVLLLLPFEISTITLMLLGFALGLVIDLSYNMLGVHMFSCVLMAFIRNYWIARLEPMGGYEASARPSLNIMGLSWFWKYALLLILVHHIPLFLLEAFNSNLYLVALLKAGISTGITFAFILIVQYILQILAGKRPSTH